MFNGFGERTPTEAAKRAEKTSATATYVREEIERRRKAQREVQTMIQETTTERNMMTDLIKRKQDMFTSPESIACAEKLSSSNKALQKKLQMRERSKRRHTRKLSEDTQRFVDEKCIMNGQSEYKDTISGITSTPVQEQLKIRRIDLLVATLFPQRNHSVKGIQQI